MYSAKVNDQPTTFGTSGLLYRSNKLMYDRATETIWHQFTGEPVIGPLAETGSLEGSMVVTLLFSLLAFTVLFAYLLWERVGLRNSEDTLRAVRRQEVMS